MNPIKFLKGYVRELAKARWNLSKGSLRNCHAQGMHSILLREDPIVRMFVTTSDHEMWRTDEHQIPTTIAFHSHHCDIRLEAVHGEFANITWLRGGREFRFHGYRFNSKINGGDGQFESLGPTVYHDRVPSQLTVKPGSPPVNMEASEIHSVVVPKGKVSAWLVTESTEDLNYSPIAWSTQDLTKFTPKNLYLPISHEEASILVDSVTS